VLFEEHTYSNSMVMKKIRLMHKDNSAIIIFNSLVGKSMIKCMPWAVRTLKPLMIYQATSCIFHLNRKNMSDQVLPTNENVGIVIVLVVILIIAAVLV
jgi:hypothetical protein